MEDFNAWKEKLRDNSDIVSVISRYLSLNKKGKTWWANCPFHFEKTPSFAVNEVEQYYHCFGCGATGDVFGFVQKMEAVDFIEACEILAKYANMKMPDFTDNENITKLKQQKQVVYKILKEATMYYMNNLRLDQAEVARKYIAKRQLDKQTLNNFAIGYSLGWDNIIGYMTGKGFTTADLKMAGLVDEKDGKFYDSYAKRLIFPIINSNNDVIGFSARMLEDANFAKYKNTAQTIVFNKSRVLYGINNLKKLKQTDPLNEIIIVEGQMDLISIYKNGVKNAVATMGTALTPLHAKELKRYCNKIVLCFDGDGAGKKASVHSIDILTSEGLQVYVASLPDGVDPDEYVLKNGKDKFYELISNAKYWVEYLITQLAQNANLENRQDKNEFILNALHVVNKLESSSEQVVYLDFIKNLTNISIDILKHDLENIGQAKPANAPQHTQEVESSVVVNKENAYVKAIRFVIAAQLHKKEYAKLNEQISEYITNGDYKRILQQLQKSNEANESFRVSQLFDMFNVEENPDIKLLIEYEFVGGIDNKDYYNDCINTILKYGLELKQKQIMQQITAEKDLTKRRELTGKLAAVLSQIKALN